MIRNSKKTVIVVLLGALAFCGVTYMYRDQAGLIVIAMQQGIGKSNVPSSKKDLQIDDIYISVKTSGRLHQTRLSLILNTWWTQAKEQTYIFTDTDDASLNNFTNGHVINTHCKATHSRPDLSCKMESEYSFGLKMNKKWWCHFDDDNYVNIEQLVNLLRNYSSDEDYYLGRLSWIEKQIVVRYNYLYHWIDFATGGAGVCISNKTATRMIPLASNGKFQETSDKTGKADDVVLGFIVNYQLGVSMTKVDGFHSHMEKLYLLPNETLKYQASLAYGRSENTIALKNPVFSANNDQSRFYSLHCEIHPDIDWCVKKTIPPLIKTS